MRALRKVQNQISDSVTKTLEISHSCMIIVERRKPGKGMELLHNNFVVRSALVDLHGCLLSLLLSPLK